MPFEFDIVAGAAVPICPPAIVRIPLEVEKASGGAVDPPHTANSRAYHREPGAPSSDELKLIPLASANSS